MKVNFAIQTVTDCRLVTLVPGVSRLTDVCLCAQEYLMLEFSQCPRDVFEQLGAGNTLILLDKIVGQRSAHGLGI